MGAEETPRVFLESLATPSELQQRGRLLTYTCQIRADVQVDIIIVHRVPVLPWDISIRVMHGRYAQI